MTTYITLDQLIAAKACVSQREEFSRLFPSGKARVTIKRAVSVASVFDWDWAAENLLTPEALADYKAARAKAVADYDAATAEAWADYKAATAPALADYDAAAAPALADYDAAMAEAFARAYITQ